MSFWGQEREDELVDLVNDGLSSGQIAKHLGCTRNAVIGKAVRMGLQLSGVTRKQIARSNQNRNKKKKKRKPQSKPTTHVQSYFVQPIPAEPFKPVRILNNWHETEITEGIDLIDLEPHHCRWPHACENGEVAKLCGEKVEPGSSYCATHLRRSIDSTVLVRQRRRRAA